MDKSPEAVLQIQQLAKQFSNLEAAENFQRSPVENMPFESEKFDLVITDYKMSPMNGLELINRLRERNLETPIILLSGFTDTIGLRPETTGADVVLQKNANEIANLVRQARRLLNPVRRPPASQLGRKRQTRGAG